jgi:hypothetical protein
MEQHETQSGFVALMSVIIISAILLTLVFTMNLLSFFARYDAYGEDNKRVSLGLADACVEAAKLKIAQNAAYVPASTGDCVSVGDTCGALGATKTCRICSVSAGAGNSYTITTGAVITGSYTELSVKELIANSSSTITSYVENTAKTNANCVLP